MSETDSGERTEKASEQKIKEAVKKGSLTRSQDVTAWLGIAAAVVTMPAAIAAGANVGRELFVSVVTIIRNPDPEDALLVLEHALTTIPSMLGAMLAAVAIVALLGSVAQGGVRLRGIPARFEQFNILNGVKRMFGMQALWQGVKALLKTAAIGGALWFVVAGLVPVLTSSGRHSVTQIIDIAVAGTANLIWTAVAVGVILAGLDVLVVMRRNRKHTMSTKKEARDEHKRSEGDPLIKGQRRARQMAMSRNRMIASIADADVVPVNPTHVAVALRYEPGKSAPRVVAKGAGEIAARIREKATETGVPLVRDIPLARSLHRACEIGQEIPEDLFDAVARVLVFVDALKRRGSARGIHTLPQRKSK